MKIGISALFATENILNNLFVYQLGNGLCACVRSVMSDSL